LQIRADSVAKGKHRLTQRELEVLELSARGLANKEIAHKLSLSNRTVQSHLRNIVAELAVRSRIETVMLGLKNRWIRMDMEGAADS
jgi:DNA-binding NarL/FixJ family response regulator